MPMKCRACGSSKTSYSFTSSDTHGHRPVSLDQFAVYFCRSCNCYFLDHPENEPNYYSKYYPTDYYHSDPKLVKILTFLSFSLKKNQIQKHFKNKPSLSILDIGCGQGEFLRSLPNTFKKYGVEINPPASKIASQHHLKIFTGDINTINFCSNKFDCITMWHVIEHLSHPQLTLRKIHQLLKPKGILLFTTPNSQCLGFKYGQKHYFHLDSPRHLFIPCQKSLSLLLNKAGFSKYKFNYPFYDYPLDLFWSLRYSSLKYLAFPFYPIFKLLSRETISTVVYK